MRTKSIWFIVNPISGGKSKKHIIQQIEIFFSERKENIQIHLTEYAGHGKKITEQAVQENINMVCAVGGDGSVHEISTVLIHSNTTLAIIPSGSGNGFARHFGIQKHVKRNLQRLISNNTVLVDAVKLNKHYFISNAGIGFDAYVAQQFSSSKTRGLISYARIVIRSLFRFTTFSATLKIAEKELTFDQLLFLSIANTSELGNGFKLAPNANATDGEVEIIVISKPSLFQFIKILIQSYRGTLRTNPTVHYWKVKKGTIICSQRMCQVDGEYIDNKLDKIEFETIEKAIKLIV